MAATTTSTEAELLAEYWREVFLNELRENLVFDQFALRSSHPNNSGTVVHWLSIGDLSSAAALTEATDPTEYSLSAGDLTAGLSQYGATIKISDLLQDTWLKESMAQVMERLSRNAALTIDSTVRNAVFTAGGTAQYAGTAVARNSIATDGSFDFDVAEIQEATATLESANVPRMKDGFYAGVIHPHVKYDLMRDSAFTNMTQYVEKGIDRSYKWEVGEIGGVRFVQTTQALAMDASGSASTDVYQSYIIGDEYLGVSELYGTQVVVKNPAPSSSLDLYGTVGWKTARAHKELSATRMIRVESGATLGD